MNKIETILEYLHQSAEKGMPIPPHKWVDAALSLNSLVGDLHDELTIREQNLAKMRVEIGMADVKMPVSKINDHVEASDLYREMRRLKLKIAQIEEFIRLAKAQARLKDNEYING